MNRRLSTKYFQVSQRVWGTKLLFVNVYMIANRPGAAKGWVLVDTGLKGSAGKIIAMAEDLFGPGTRPAAIVLTHGHGDHAGGLEELLKIWNVPVYAHALELPYLTGLSSYPPADPSLRDGVMSLLSVFFPTAPINLGTKVKAIDMEEGIPELPEWKVIHTPGHTPGHISLFLPINSTLVVGDAFSTTKAESALYSFSSFKKLTGPPRYFTTDWEAAAESVRRLTALEPRAVAAGHGPVMRGRELHDELHELADNFEQLAIPAKGRYVGHPAIADEMGVKYIPPYVSSGILKASIGIAAALATFFIIRGLQE
ncbi:MBL fold metallo-hydrolase [Mucilaginibacter sp. Mucisp86]|uniref:MBL fold metallo-hydrolase n=1 Tax=Mucilaginibacter sp. Mucisp86 TaxID=3243060 RepID=UPI000EB53197